MKDKDKERSSCSYFVALLVIGIVILGLWRFFSSPDALKDVVDFVVGAAGCAGIAVLAILLLLAVRSLSGEPAEMPVERAAGRQYEVTMRRAKPDFDTEEAYSSMRSGVLLGTATFVFCFFVVAGLVEGIKNTDLGWICLGSFFTPVMLLQGFMGIKMTLDGVSVLVKKRGWMKRAATADATIVDRNVYCEVDYYEGHSIYTYEFVLEIDTGQAVAELDEQFVGVTVSKRVYNKYAFVGGTPRVYYSEASPLTFLIKGE